MHRASTTLLVLTILSSGAAQVRAQATGVFDANWRAVQERMATEQHRRCDRLGFLQRTNCYSQVRQNFIMQGDVPGTDQYVQKHYGYMAPSELNQQIMRLNRTYGVARHVHPGDPTTPGEISYEQIEFDVNAIRQLIRARGGLPS